jgi:Zn-dependent protease
VAALRRFGIPASAPMFIPGFGAVVRMETYPQTAKEDARVGLAGPIYGLGCAALVAAAYYATGYPLLAAIASVGAWINLFNLVPIWQLDGSRGFRALSKLDRWIFVVLAGTCGLFFDEGLYLAIAAVGAFRIFSSEAPAEGDRRTATEFAVLLVGLGLITALNVPTPA